MGFLLDVVDFLAGPLWDQDKKSSSTPPPVPPAAHMPDYSGMFESMMEGFTEQITTIAEQQASMQQQSLLAMQQYMNQSALAQSNMIKPPTVSEALPIDWTQQQAQIANKVAGLNAGQEASRKGRWQTILTSPLLDEEEADTTGSIIAG